VLTGYCLQPGKIFFSLPFPVKTIKFTVHLKTLIIGLGNTILSDDGAGIYAARKVAEKCIDHPKIDVVEASLGGVGLLDLMTGYDRVIILDAIFTNTNSPGDVYHLSLDDLGDPSNPSNTHFLDVRTSVELGRKLGLAMPKTISIFAIEIKDNTTFSDKLTQEVEQALPLLTQRVLEFLNAES
jgi:hydrogenase maturation protease